MLIVLTMILLHHMFVGSSLFLFLLPIMIIIWYCFYFHYLCYESSWFNSVYRMKRVVLVLLLLWLVCRLFLLSYFHFDNSIEFKFILLLFLCPSVAVQYFYMTNWLISGDISRDIYKSTKILKSDYFTQAIQGKLISTNQLELTEVNVIKSIGSKWVRS